MDFFNEEMRRDPYPVYEQLRSISPTYHVPPPFDAWLILHYEGVKRVLHDHDVFSSAVPAPKNWFIFFDPPNHTKLRKLIQSAFVPRVVANLEPRIRDISRQLLDAVIDRGQMDLALDYSVPLPLKVIAEMIGIPASDWARFKQWSDCILQLSYARSGTAEEGKAVGDFIKVTAEMSPYLAEMISLRKKSPTEDLLTRLVHAEVEGERLSHDEILGFFQLLVVGGQETTTNLVNNAMLCFLEHPDQLARIRADMSLLPAGIEEVLRYRSPLQWVMRTPRREVEINGQVIPAGKLVLAMIGSANRDPLQFNNASRFDISRDPNQHLAFGLGIHSCMGAALARIEARIALTDLFSRLGNISLTGPEPWEPRRALHVHGPARLRVCFQTD
jgi:cytochrome P450